MLSVYLTLKAKRAPNMQTTSTKRAKWESHDEALLIEKLNNGERVTDIAHLFGDKTPRQISSKVSVLRQAGKVKPPTEELAPSRQAGRIPFPACTNNLAMKLLSSLSPHKSKSKQVLFDDEESDDENGVGDDGEGVTKVKDVKEVEKKEVEKKEVLQKSPRKLEGGCDSPVVYWSLQRANDWVLMVVENPSVSMGIKVVEDGVEVHWSIDPPDDLHIAIGMSISELYKQVHKKEDIYFIQAPQPLITTTSLIKKVSHSKLRIVVIPWKLESSDVLF